MASEGMAYTREFDVVMPAGLVARALDAPSSSRLASDGDRAEATETVADGGSQGSFVLLVDQSGSVARGLGRHLALVDLLATALEASGTRFEVLGFTTTHHRSNPAIMRWIAQGRPPEPGRLTPLLHVVYKTFEQPWDASSTRGDPDPRTCLDRLMRPEYMRDNVDGESIDWAVGRLNGEGTVGRRLVVISEASPVDEATMMVNGNDFLGIDLDRAIANAVRSGVAVTGLCTGKESDAAFHYADRVWVGPNEPALPAVLRTLGHLGLSRDPGPSPVG